jgi:PAS domain S-box-containing protein
VAALVAFVIASFAVTSRVRRLRALSELHQEQARLLDLSRDAIFVRAVDDVITYWNRSAEEIYGWKSEEALGKVTHQLLQTAFPVPFEEIMQTLHGVGRWEGELLQTTRAGRHVTVESRWTLQRDDSRRPIGTIETNNNITERKRAEEALRRTQETYLAEAQQIEPHRQLGLGRLERRNILVGGVLQNFRI